MKQISIVCILLTLLIACKARKPAGSRQHLKMPELVNAGKFKHELPIDNLKNLRSIVKTAQLFNYFFVVDKDGNVAEGRYDWPKDTDSTFLVSYIETVFNKYKWRPAYYRFDKGVKLKSVLKLSIYNSPNNPFYDISIRLVHLSEKEKVEDIFEEKNLIYKWRVK